MQQHMSERSHDPQMCYCHLYSETNANYFYCYWSNYKMSTLLNCSVLLQMLSFILLTPTFERVKFFLIPALLWHQCKHKTFTQPGRSNYEMWIVCFSLPSPPPHHLKLKWTVVLWFKKNSCFDRTRTSKYMKVALLHCGRRQRVQKHPKSSWKRPQSGFLGGAAVQRICRTLKRIGCLICTPQPTRVIKPCLVLANHTQPSRVAL